MKKLHMLWQLLRGSRMKYILAIVAVAVATLFTYLTPLALRYTIDTVIGKKAVTMPLSQIPSLQNSDWIALMRRELWIPGLVMVLLTIVASLATYLKGRWSAQASEQFAKKLRNRLYTHLQRLPFSYHARAETGDLIQRCTSDVDTIRRFLSVQLVEVGRAIIMIILVIPIMLMLSKTMTIVSMAVVPIIIIYSFVFSLRVQKLFKIADETEGEMSTILQETLSGVRVVRAFARQPYEIGRFKNVSANYRDRCQHLITMLAWYWASTDLLSLFQIGAVMLIGTYLTLSGKITLGTLVVFMTYENSLLWPVRQLGRVLTDMGKALVSLQRVSEILHEPQEEMDGICVLPEDYKLKGRIEAKNLYFAYPEGKPVLQDVNFTIEAGETVAILGHTGSGKSTLVNLIPRLYDYQRGSLKVDDIEVSTLNRQFIRKQVAIVLQEPFLYSRDLKQNIAFGRADSTEEEIQLAAQIASIHDVIESFDHGYDTVIGEKGVTLSGGQKQRVAIARAILQDSAILIFDDSLSAVDTETDRHIQQSLKARKGNATTIIISHRLTTLSEADRILVLDHGRIVQNGTHHELLLQEGLYKRIWNIQNDLESELADIGEEVINSDKGSMEFSPVASDKALPWY